MTVFDLLFLALLATGVLVGIGTLQRYGTRGEPQCSCQRSARSWSLVRVETGLPSR